MTIVWIDRRAGFCAGVKRTIRGAREIIDSGEVKGDIVSYGELIHNPHVTRDLERQGIRVQQELTGLKPSDLVVIRAHGIPLAEEHSLEERRIPYLDLTCVRVKAIHKMIAEKRKTGFTILIVGDPNHPEVRGHLGYAGVDGLVLSSVEEAAALPLDKNQRYFLLAQTTTSPDLYAAITAVLKERGHEPVAKDSLCPFVRKRQLWIATYSRKAEAALIIGGRNSSNTRKLFDIAAKNGPAYLIGSTEEMDLDRMLAFPSLAVTAGASTPDHSIDQVLAMLRGGGASLVVC